VIDPDGARPNEVWFAGTMTPKHYARNFYRPAGHEQVEWTFPNSYKTNYFDRTLPGTKALMRVMDDLKPALVVSLHNAGFGGVYTISAARFRASTRRSMNSLDGKSCR